MTRVPEKVATSRRPCHPRVGPGPTLASFLSEPGPSLELLKMSLREYKARLAARVAGGNNGAGDRSSLMSGYEMYRHSLLKHLVGAEYADASSDDLSSDWEEPDELKGKVKKVPPFSSLYRAPCAMRPSFGHFHALPVCIEVSPRNSGDTVLRRHRGESC